MATLTSANSSFFLTVAGLFPTPVEIQGYAADDAFTVSELNNAETLMGVDGRLSAGFVPFIVPLTVNLQADSASNGIFDTWVASESATQDKYEAQVVILLPATKRLYTLSKGYLKGFSAIPDAKKILQSRKFSIDFQSISVGAA